MSDKIDNPKLPDSVKSLKKYLNFLQGLRVWIKPWDDVVRTIFRKAPHLASRVHPDNQDLLEWTTQLLVDLLLWPSSVCPSKETTCRILEAYCLFSREAQEYMRWRDANIWSDFLKPHYDDNDVSNLLSPTATDYRRSSGYSHASYMMKQYLEHAFESTDLRFLRATATYGLAMRLDMDVNIFIRLCHPIQKTIFRSVGMSEFSRIFLNLRRNDGIGLGDRRGFGRILGIAQALYATSLALSGEVSRARKHASFLETYWDTLPDPLVSEEEIVEFLFVLEEEHRQLEMRFPDYEPKPVVDLGQVLAAFVSLFGRRRWSYEPRSLSHLSRCAVRSAIVLNSPLTLPASVEGLHLPKTLQSFILCNARWRPQS